MRIPLSNNLYETPAEPGFRISGDPKNVIFGLNPGIFNALKILSKAARERDFHRSQAKSFQPSQENFNALKILQNRGPRPQIPRPFERVQMDVYHTIPRRYAMPPPQ